MRTLLEKAALKSQIEVDYKATLAKNAKEMEDTKSSFEERLKEAQAAGSVSYGR
jgi:hypothetical protein